MAHADLRQFLIALAKHPALRQELASGGTRADEIMTQAGLSDVEKKLISDGDEDAIRKYLGDDFQRAIMVTLKP